MLDPLAHPHAPSTVNRNSRRGRAPRDRTAQDTFERRRIHLVEQQPVSLNALVLWAIVHDPFHADFAVELLGEAGGEEAVAEEAPGGIENKDLELRLGDRESMRPNGLGQPTDNGVEVLDVVDFLTVLLAQAIVDRFPLNAFGSLH